MSDRSRGSGRSAGAFALRSEPTHPRFAVRITAVALATLVSSADALLAQPTLPPPSFASEASAITIDVVVLDRDGEPLRDLRREDFRVFEDGKPQTTVAFQARDLALDEPSAAAGRPAEAVASNAGAPETPGRTLALLLDDLGLSAAVTAQLKLALSEWVRTKAHPRDEITIMSTSGDLWWSDRVARGRSDLLAVLERLEGKMLASGSNETMSEWEAYSLAVLESSTDAFERSAGDLDSRGGTTVITHGDGTYTLTSNSIMDRVTQRWLDTGACPPNVDQNDPLVGLNRCRRRVRSRAQELHAHWVRRAGALYGSIARLSQAFGDVSGRKAILIVSETFLNDTSLNLEFRKAVDATQRANTTLYFLGARGLAGLARLDVTTGQPTRGQDVGLVGAEEGTLGVAGAVALAEATGGASITSTNDLAQGLERMARDASAYYLVGYQPDKPPDGKWHDIEVRVRREGVKVRARRTYLATRPGEQAPGTNDGADTADQGTPKGKRPIPPTLLAGAERGGIPLRMAAHVQDTNHSGSARVQIVLEIDNGQVPVDKSTTPWKATLDLTIMAAGLDRGLLVPVDQRLHLDLDPKEVGSGWWLLMREVWLPPGVAQIRAIVRDMTSKNRGMVTQRIVVPDVDQPYLSTPLLTDRALPFNGSDGQPRLVPTASRLFGPHSPLYCQFEVFSFGGFSIAGIPQLWASYVLQRHDGSIVETGSPTLIETDGYRAVRRLVLPIDTLADGMYVLRLTVEDRLAVQTMAHEVPFAIVRSPSEPTADDAPPEAQAPAPPADAS